MLYPVDIEGFESRQLAIKAAGLFLTPGPKLMIDGQLAPKGPQRGQYLLRRNDGTEVVAQLRSVLLGFDPVPQLIIEDQQISVVEPLRWYEWLWSGLPLLLLLLGGGLGALAGGVAFTVNIRVFHSQMSSFTKYAAAVAVSIAAVVAYFVLAVIFNIVLLMLRGS